MQKIWITSDNHWGHRSILKFARDTRIGDTIEEMDEKMIEIWNEQVALADIVYMLGDFSFHKAEKTAEILRRLKGQFRLIRGNHDHWINQDTSKFFEWIKDYNEIKMDDHKVIMFHFPIHEWHKIHHGSFHLYGHVHGSFQHPGRAMDVGIDARPKGDMRLWEWDEVRDFLKDRPVLAHHGKVGGNDANF